MFIHGWRAVYKARRESRLVTEGLYRFVRHPQYIGLFLALFGEGVVHWPTIFSVGLFPVIVLAYYFLARKEEGEMIRKFGEEYRRYMRRVPMLVPHPRRWNEMAQNSQQPKT
ncbi:methyltransferase family protein [Pelagerythrobacter marinus]|uniref:methyltransferase family protein n=1 Tax=Pelagerythrobacter marinus TaxID=538382 RepID=UPI00389A4F52